MEAMRKAWTDERLDDLSRNMERGFDRCERATHAARVELKSDLHDAREELKAEIASVVAGIGGQRTETCSIRDELKAEIGGLRGEMHSIRDELKAESRGLRGEIRGVREQIDSLRRTMIQVAAAGLATIAAGFIGLIATQL